MTRPLAASKASWVGGRPPVEGPPPRSTRSPRPSRASTRWDTVDRASPVARASSARLAAAPSRTSWNMTPGVRMCGLTLRREAMRGI